MPTPILVNKVALVTGASSGIGRAAALLFASEGARVVAGARRQPELDALVHEITAAGGTAAALAGDVRSESYAEALVELAVSRFGQLDVAFNNAGAADRMGPTTGFPRAAWEETLAVNLTGGFLGAKHQIAAMLKAGDGRGGSVIFCSGVVGNSFGFPGAAAYAASKAGLVGLTRALASEYGPQGIRVNALLPGSVDTPSYREFAHTPEMVGFLAGIHALKRVASPEEIARSALYLASDAASFTTGSALVVDGGASVTRT